MQMCHHTVDAKKKHPRVTYGGMSGRKEVRLPPISAPSAKREKGLPARQRRRPSPAGSAGRKKKGALEGIQGARSGEGGAKRQ